MKYYCNPINTNYRYQFYKEQNSDTTSVSREAADPTMLCYKGMYYIFASMTLGVWVSDDLVTWENHPLPTNLPMYDYAPDVRVMGEYVYFSASRSGNVCNFYRTKDILHGPYEEIAGTFAFWDPNLFVDDDGKVYFYWGCSNDTPIWGMELDPATFAPRGEKHVLIEGNPYRKGFERFGEDHSEWPRSEDEIEPLYMEFLKDRNILENQVPKELVQIIKGMFSMKPYIEGAWMDKFNGKYYLQYACPGTELNVYADGVYISENPLGPFRLADTNPYSYKPGGFITGAGHGSTMSDIQGNLWHASTMRISVNHRFERRVGLWIAGIDEDGELFCNQRYGDWPMSVQESRMNPWEEPKWYLLSYKKSVLGSSYRQGKEPENVVDEDIRTWWKAESAVPGEWLEIDLGACEKVHAVQINFADDQIDVPVPGDLSGEQKDRHIDERNHVTRWKLEASVDGEKYIVLEDKSKTDTDLPHDLVVMEEGEHIRYLRLTVIEVPFQQSACISGFRVFGVGNVQKAEVPLFTVERTSEVDIVVEIKSNGRDYAVGYNILWGTSPKKLYHSYMIFGEKQRIGALVKGKDYFVRVDAFNEAGITKGNVIKMNAKLEGKA